MSTNPIDIMCILTISIETNNNPLHNTANLINMTCTIIIPIDKYTPIASIRLNRIKAAPVVQTLDKRQRGEYANELRRGQNRYLDAVVAGDDAPVLHLDVGGRVRELALAVRARALAALELAAHLQLEPARIFHVQHVVQVHVHNGHRCCRRRWRPAAAAAAAAADAAIQHGDRLHFSPSSDKRFRFSSPSLCLPFLLLLLLSRLSVTSG